MKIIFLDIDGVLNGYDKYTYFIADLFDSRNIFGYDIFGVHKHKVRLLSRIVRSTDAKVVLCSSWRSSWRVPYFECRSRMKELKDLFYKYNIDVLDITPKINGGTREDEIRKWLSDTDYDITNFVILDDEPCELLGFVGKELVQTSSISPDEMIHGYPHENTGLKRKHIKQAIKILKGEI